VCVSFLTRHDTAFAIDGDVNPPVDFPLMAVSQARIAQLTTVEIAAPTSEPLVAPITYLWVDS